jgi:hypothetical protein
VGEEKKRECSKELGKNEGWEDRRNGENRKYRKLERTKGKLRDRSKYE